MAKRERAPKGTGSITPYGNGRFKGIITTGYKIDPVTKTKKRITKTFTGATRKEVQQKITEYQYKVNTGKINPIAAPLTFNQYKDRWLTMKKVSLKPQSYNTYKKTVDAIPFGDTPLKDITVTDINTALLEMSKTMKPATLKRYKAIMHSLFDSARKEKIIVENPITDSISIKKDTVSPIELEQHVLTAQEAARLIMEAKTYKDVDWLYPLVRTALETGMRKGELRALQFNKLGEDTILVNQGVSDIKGASRSITSPKTSSSIRRIHVDKQLITFLKHIPHQEETDFVFHSPKDVRAPLSISPIDIQFKKLLSKTGIDKPIRFHDLRHTHATLLIMAGVNIKTVSTRLGHASVAITLNRYAHALPQQDKEAGLLISSMLLHTTTNS